MKRYLSWVLLGFLVLPASSMAKPTALDLVGNWEGTVLFGKFKFTLLLRVATNNTGGVEVKMDLPDQGQNGLRIDALLFNAQDVRLEIDQFGTAYNGKVNSALTEIAGEFEEGPGGRPEPLVFRRSSKVEAPPPQLTYTFASGEKKDVRGYWKGEVEAGPPGMKALAALNIGRTLDGEFRAALDLPEQGARNIRATAVEFTDGKLSMQWQMFQGTFQAALQGDGDELTGPWISAGRTNSLTFHRLDRPLQLIPEGVSYTPDPGNPHDPRGFWKGALNVPGRKLRLVFKLGRAPDGTYAGTLSSLDQGGQEIPMSSASFAAPTLKMEWRGVRGKFEGSLSEDGKTLDGNWEQFGNPMPLKLERTTDSHAE